MDRRDLIARMLRCHLGDDTPDLLTDVIIVSTGSGMGLALQDHMAQQYPDRTLVMLDLPGSWGLDKRIMILDYLMHAWNIWFVCWAGLWSAALYPARLQARGLVRTPRHMWVTVRGMDATAARRAWRALGARLVDDPWAGRPLGVVPVSYRDVHIGHPAAHDAARRVR